MPSPLYAMLFRMKYINRWALMRTTMNETLSQHSMETAMIAHALAVITNEKLGGSVNAERTALIALFHDTPEILTGDLPTPVKHGSPNVEAAYGEIESEAVDLFIKMAPDYMKDAVAGIYHESDREILALVKAADKIAALIKCLEEEKGGNGEFRDAEAATRKSIAALRCPAADIFLSDFIDSFSLTLDALKKAGDSDHSVQGGHNERY